MIENTENLSLADLLKFNDALIKLNLNKIVVIKESHIGDILTLTDHVASDTNSREIIKKKLSAKKYYFA